MHKPFLPHPLASAMALAGLIANGCAFAQQADDTAARLPPVEVRAEVPGSTAGEVRAVEIERYQASDLEDVFSGQPDVAVGGGHGVAQKVYVRGVEDTLLNVTIDAAVQAGQVFHHTGRISIEPELIKRVEVQAGAGDALAGPGALGGAVRFITKDPGDLLRPDESAGGSVKATYFGNGEGFKLNTSVYGRLGERWSAMATATHQDRDDYKDGDGDTVAATQSRQDLAYLKLVGNIDSEQTVRLSYDRREDSGVRTHRPQWVPSSFNRAYPLDSVRETWTAKYAFDSAGNDAVNLEATLYHTDVSLKQNVFDRWGEYNGAVTTSGFDVRNTSRFGAHRVTYGVDHRRDRVTAGPGGDSSAVAEKGTVTGFYVQDDIELSPRTHLGVGARYDRYRLDDASGQRFSDDGLSPNVKLSYAATPELTLLAGHTRALRGVEIRDAFKLDSASNDPDLEAERARSTEIGFEFARNALSFGGKLYQTDIGNAIADPIARPAVYENVGTLRSRGVILNAGYRWEALSVGASFHHNVSRIGGERLNAYEHNGLGASIGDTLILTADWRAAPGLELGWKGRFVRGIDDFDTGVGEIDKPGYAVHDVYARWTPAATPDVTLSLTVKNLFDKDYLDHATNEDFQHIAGYSGIVGSAEPGRELRVSVAVRF